MCYGSTMTTKICAYSDCQKPVQARGYCRTHYYFLKDHGNLPGVVPEVCSADGCDLFVHSKHLCQKHYTRQKRYGDVAFTQSVRPIGKTDLDKFMSLVEKTDTCWLWTGAPNCNGYGLFYPHVGKRALSHRWAYAQFVEPIPRGKWLDHRCGVRMCVNPDHLQVATPRENNENRTVLDSRNTSGYRGVTWDKTRGIWIVRVGHNGRGYYGGRFENIDEANRAAIALRNKLHTNNLKDREDMLQ